jgi:hypothetical protein
MTDNKTQPFKATVEELELGFTWKCEFCGWKAGLRYAYQERAEDMAIEHIRDEHGPRAIVNFKPIQCL